MSVPHAFDKTRLAFGNIQHSIKRRKWMFIVNGSTAPKSAVADPGQMGEIPYDHDDALVAGSAGPGSLPVMAVSDAS